MKYKLISTQTKEEHLCDKITIDGFDYYISLNEQINCGDFVYNSQYNDYFKRNINAPLESDGIYFKILATNNLNIDVPKVVDEIWVKAWKIAEQTGIRDHEKLLYLATAWCDGHSTSQETHPFSEEDMFDFATFRNGGDVREEFKLWKEQQSKVLFYE